MHGEKRTTTASSRPLFTCYHASACGMIQSVGRLRRQSHSASSAKSMFPLRLCLFLLVATASCFAEAPSSKAVDTVVVCAPDFVAASAQWVAYRREQGHRLVLVSGKKTKQQIKETIKSHARDGALKFVVLLGDAPPSNQVKRGTHVETDRVKSNVIAKWGAEPSYASDNYYADLDDDGSPDVALGRICADTPSELVSVLAKVMAYEQSSDVGAWRRKVNFVAGVGGFGVLADKILESAAKKFITDGIPASYQTSMTQASWRSPTRRTPGCSNHKRSNVSMKVVLRGSIWGTVENASSTTIACQTAAYRSFLCAKYQE